MSNLPFRALILAALVCRAASAQQTVPIRYRWAYRNPLSITNSSASDLGEGSYNGTVNSLLNVPPQGGLALRYSHGGTFGILPNGSIAAVWQGSPQYWEGSQNQAAYWALSHDSGETWGPATLVYALPTGPLWGPVIHSQGGAVWMFFSGSAPPGCKFPFDGAGNMAWPPGGDLQVVKSTDNGQTWSKPTVIAPIEMNGGSGKLGVGRLVANAAGEWLLPFWRERSGPPCWPETLANYTGVPGVYRSKDKGATWHLVTDAITPAPKTPASSWLIENAIAPFRAGKAVGLLQIFRANTSRIWQSTSTDDGATWAPAQPSRLPAPDSKSDITSLPDGSLLVAFNNATKARVNLTVARSTDGGASWQHLATVDTGPGQFSYPSLLHIKSTGQVAVIYSVWHSPTNASAVVAQAPAAHSKPTPAPPPAQFSGRPNTPAPSEHSKKNPAPQPAQQLSGHATAPAPGQRSKAVVAPPPAQQANGRPDLTSAPAGQTSGAVEVAGRRLAQLPKPRASLGGAEGAQDEEPRLYAQLPESRKLLGGAVRSQGKRPRSRVPLPERVSWKILESAVLEEKAKDRQGRQLRQVPYDQGAWGLVSYGIRVAYFDLQAALEMQTTSATTPSN